MQMINFCHRKFTSLSRYIGDTVNCLFSYIVGQMNWCGSTSDPSGMNFTGCESYDPKNCPDHVTYSFWAAASEQVRCDFQRKKLPKLNSRCSAACIGFNGTRAAATQRNASKG